jgi:hypothetical protein
MNLSEPMLVTELGVTSVVVGETQSTICLEGTADKYGQVFVTYVLDSAGDRTGGTYSGSARAFPNGEDMVAALFRMAKTWLLQFSVVYGDAKVQKLRFSASIM